MSIIVNIVVIFYYYGEEFTIQKHSSIVVKCRIVIHPQPDIKQILLIWSKVLSV